MCGTEVSCEVRKTLDRVGDKWSLLVMAKLNGGTLRFTELRRQIDGISQRMLTLTLRQLERDGLVRRTVYAVVPPRVDYNLTALGTTLLDPIHALVQWTLAHQPEVAEARRTYDERAETA
jgi:DNA-binding HxlR family transcriptional regulator